MAGHPEERNPFKFAPEGVLDTFDKAFGEGALAGEQGQPYTDCPHGLPGNPKWTQGSLLMSEGPERAGWLLGWWAAGFFYSIDDEEKSAFQTGAGLMAALLWGGAWEFDQQCYEGELVSESEIAAALGCTVEEVRKRAEAEGWAHVHVPRDRQGPLLTVHSNPNNTSKSGNNQ